MYSLMAFFTMKGPKQFSRLLTLYRPSKFPAMHTGVNEFCNQLTATNDPESICSKLHLRLALTLMASLSMVIRHNQLNGEMTGCFTLWQRDDILNLPPKQGVTQIIWNQDRRESLSLEGLYHLEASLSLGRNSAPVQF